MSPNGRMGGWRSTRPPVKRFWRSTNTAKATVLKLLVELGEFCSIYQDHVLTNLSTKRVEIDEIWAFVGSKQKNVPVDKQGEWGDVWT